MSGVAKLQSLVQSVGKNSDISYLQGKREDRALRFSETSIALNKTLDSTPHPSVEIFSFHFVVRRENVKHFVNVSFEKSSDSVWEQTWYSMMAAVSLAHRCSFVNSKCR